MGQVLRFIANLDPAQMRSLRQIAFEERRSMASLLRTAVNVYLEKRTLDRMPAKFDMSEWSEHECILYEALGSSSATIDDWGARCLRQLTPAQILTAAVNLECRGAVTMLPRNRHYVQTRVSDLPIVPGPPPSPSTVRPG